MAAADFESVQHPDPEFTRAMFDRMAARYDKFTCWMSLGYANSMRRDTLKDLKPGHRLLDVATGTGDLALAAAKRVGPTGQVVGLDFSTRMLEVAERRRQREPDCPSQVKWVCQGAETLPLEGQSFDWVVSGFALRLLHEHIDKILDGMLASLGEGGRIALLDLTEPEGWFRRGLYKTFFYSYVAVLGWILFGRNYPVAYLPDSSARFAKAAEFVEKLKARGFRNVTAKSYILGTVTLYRGEK